MQEMTAGYDAIWLIATETAMWDERGLVQAWLEANAQRVDEAHLTAMWDERGLVQAWLEANAQRVDEAHFAQVDVYRYVR